MQDFVSGETKLCIMTINSDDEKNREKAKIVLGKL